MGTSHGKYQTCKTSDTASTSSSQTSHQEDYAKKLRTLSEQAKETKKKLEDEKKLKYAQEIDGEADLVYTEICNYVDSGVLETSAKGGYTRKIYKTCTPDGDKEKRCFDVYNRLVQKYPKYKGVGILFVLVDAKEGKYALKLSWG